MQQSLWGGVRMESQRRKKNLKIYTKQEGTLDSTLHWMIW